MWFVFNNQYTKVWKLGKLTLTLFGQKFRENNVPDEEVAIKRFHVIFLG